MMSRDGEEENGSEMPKSSLKAKQQIFLCRFFLDTKCSDKITITCRSDYLTYWLQGLI